MDYHWNSGEALISGSVREKLRPIEIRCIYRVIEFAQGYDGYLRTTEWCFYVLDTLPLFAAILVWLYVWPPSVLSNTTAPEMPLHVRNDPTSRY